MISIEDLHLTYRSSGAVFHALKGVSLTLPRGQFLTLLGPSGCGKTTLLRCIAGLETPDAGCILIDGQTVFSSLDRIEVPSARRNLGMVFQSYAIWPHMSVFENAAFPLRYRSRMSRQQIRERVMECLELVRLDGFAERPAPMLSGGQQQRLALARALSAAPKLLLLDEPLSNLDTRLREEMRFELREIVKRTGVTTIFVTHEQTEALSMSDIVAVMKDGQIVQSADPRALYLHPQSEFVARFLVRSNLLPGRVLSSDPSIGGRVKVSSPVGKIDCLAGGAMSSGTVVTVVLKPETIRLLPGSIDDGSAVAGRIEAVAFMGDSVECAVRIGDALLVAKMPAHAAPAVGDEVRVMVDPHENVAFPLTAADVNGSLSETGERRPAVSAPAAAAVGE
jgi:iron(III) transport system ATP-binding protein